MNAENCNQAMSKLTQAVEANTKAIEENGKKLKEKTSEEEKEELSISFKIIEEMIVFILARMIFEVPIVF